MVWREFPQGRLDSVWLGCLPSRRSGCLVSDRTADPSPRGRSTGGAYGQLSAVGETTDRVGDRASVGGGSSRARGSVECRAFGALVFGLRGRRIDRGSAGRAG